MTKDKFLYKLSFAKSDIGVLKVSVRAGLVKVKLEKLEEDLQKLYNHIADLNEEQIKITLC